MSIKRYFGDLVVKNFNDDIEVFDDFFNLSRPSFSCLRGEFVDTDKFDIVPKRKYLEEQIKRAEEAIEANERDRESSQKYYEMRKTRLLEDKEKLINQKALGK